MPIYTDEINIYNPEAIGTGITNAGNAYKVVITEVDQNGVKVHPSGQSGANIVDYTLMDTDGTHVYESGVEVASFGQTARIGAVSGSHTVVDQSGMEVFQGNLSVAEFGVTSRIGSESGANLTFNDTSVTASNADGTPWFNLDMDAGTVTNTKRLNASSLYTSDKVIASGSNTLTSGSMTIDVSSVPSGAKFKLSTVEFEFLTDLAVGNWVLGSGSVSNSTAKSYGKSLYLRNSGTRTWTKGTSGTSFSMTITNYELRLSGQSTVLGKLSFTATFSYSGGSSVSCSITGSFNNATGAAVGSNVTCYTYTCAASYSTTVDGAALTFGSRGDGDVGPFSSTLGEGLIAVANDQTVVGKFNEIDTSPDECMFIVGNGTSDTSRSNALIVHRGGMVELPSQPLPISSGGTGETAISVQTLTPSTSPASTTVFSPASGITVNQVMFAKWGRVMMLEIYYKHTSAWTNGTQYNIGTVQTAYRPAVSTSGIAGTFGIAALLTSGAVYIRPVYATEIAANSQSYVRFPLYITNL